MVDHKNDQAIQSHRSVAGESERPMDVNAIQDVLPHGVDPSLTDAQAVADALNVDPNTGLSQAEAERRLAKFGPNELASAPPVPKWKKFLAQFRDPLVYLLLAATAISLIAWFIERANAAPGTEGGEILPFDAIVIVLILIVNAVLGYIQESKAEQAVEALSQMTAPQTNVLRDGRIIRINTVDVVPGDIIVLGEGDSVSADGRLCVAASLRIAEASLTGESVAVGKKADTLEQAKALGDRANMVFNGTSVTQGTGRAIVTGTGMNTQVGKIADLLQATEDDESPLQKEMNYVSKVLGIAVCIIAAVVLVALAITEGFNAAGHVADIAEQSDVLESELIWVGMVGIIDPPRTEVRASVSEAHRAGIRTVMITGDHPLTAARIATDLGIIEQGGKALTGDQLDALPGDDAFDKATAEVSVYARVAPEHKLKIVKSLQRQGNIVAMTGDGVNDAPAVKTADIGVAMGITGTEVTKQSAKMILADDNFSTIVAAVREGRGIFDNIRKFLRYLLSSNVGEVFTVFGGVIFAGFLGITQPGTQGVTVPLLATQLLWINLLTDAAPALAMGVDPSTDDVMARKPRRLTDRVIDGEMWGDIIFIGVIMAAVTLIGMDMHLAGGLFTDRSVAAVGHEAQMIEARTMGFTILVFAQMFNALASRSHLQSVFVGLFANKWLWGAIGVSVALQLAVIYVPFLNTAFGTVPLSAGAWLECVGLALIVLIASELRKCVLRAMRR